MQQHPRGQLAPLAVIDMVEPPRKQRVSGARIGIAPVPFYKRHLAHRRRAARIGGKEHARARPALYPQVLQVLLAAHRIVPGIEPAQRFERIAPLRNGLRRERPLGIHVKHQRSKGSAPLPLQPVAERREGARLVIGIDKAFVGIERQAPMPVPVPHHQPDKPVHPEARPLVAVRGGPERHIALRGKMLTSAVIACVLDDQEMIHAETAMMGEEMPDPRHFVAHGGKAQDIAPANSAGPVGHAVQLPPPRHRPREQPAPSPAQLVGQCQIAKTRARHPPPSSDQVQRRR